MVQRAQRLNVVEIDDTLQTHLVRIMTDYPRLVDTAKNRSGADPFVIALAATTDPKMVVVTEGRGKSCENSNSRRVQR